VPEVRRFGGFDVEALGLERGRQLPHRFNQPIGGAAVQIEQSIMKSALTL
jgi:hypothetical protein